MSKTDVHNVGNPYTMVLVTLVVCLREVQISPLKESIVVKDHLLIDVLEEEAIVRRALHRFNPKWKAL